MNLFDSLKEVTDLPHGWTSYEKAKAMASAVIALRPTVSLEIGVFAAKGLTSFALAHKEIGYGKAIGIDPFSVEAAIEGQVRSADVEWWSTQVDFEMILRTANETLAKFGCTEFSEIIRAKSRDAVVPHGIGVIRVDGNHGEEVLSDVRRYSPNCLPGSILFLDDIEWPGLSVKKAAEELEKSGWRKLYDIDDGAAYQRIKTKK